MDCINIGYYFVADWCWISMKLRVSTPISSASVELLVFSFSFWLGQGVDRAFLIVIVALVCWLSLFTAN